VRPSSNNMEIIMMERKFKKNDIVRYAFPTPDISGVGIILGVTTNPTNGGVSWIINDLSDTYPVAEYEFNVFCCPEEYVTLYVDK